MAYDRRGVGRIRCRRGLLAFAAIAVLVRGAVAAGPSSSAFRWAAEGDALSMDPYTRNEIQQLSLTGNIYEPLVQHDPQSGLEPALAESWEQVEPDRWRFHLRADVHWQDGSAFTADDVVFSFNRVRDAASLLRSTMASVVSATRVDELTVDLRTAEPDPILPQESTNWYILSKAWSERVGATIPALLAAGEQNHATRHAMGTGPYRLVEREPELRTVLEANPDWWGGANGRPERAEFFTIANANTRVAALLAGDVDLSLSVPPPDIARIEHSAGFRVLRRADLRTIFLGMNQSRDHLVHPEPGVAGNPFRDRRVREAIALAIDEDLIAARIMRGAARPTSLLWGQGVTGYDPSVDHPKKPDPQEARALLAEAGYPHGFDIVLDCPNDRYVMDEAICTALVPMLARIGITVHADIRPKSRFFKDIGPPDFATDLYLLGWAPTTYDAHNVLLNLVASRSGSQGAINFGGYANPDLDRVIERIGVESDPAARIALLDDAAETIHHDVAYVPLHQQEMLWGARDGVSVGQMPDGMLPLRLVRVAD